MQVQFMTLFHTCCETVHRSGGGENEGEWEEVSSGGGVDWPLDWPSISLQGWGTRVSPPQPWREIDVHVRLWYGNHDLVLGGETSRHALTYYE